MANVYSTQVMKDTNTHVVIKLTGSFDGSGQENNSSRIQANTFMGALATNSFPVANTQGGAANTALSFYGLDVQRIWYDSVNNIPADIQLFWNAATPQTIAYLSGNGEFDGAGNWITIQNSAKGTANCNGDIGVTTRGMVANTSYTIIIEFRKDNNHYQRGQFQDPAAFNAGQYAIKP